MSDECLDLQTATLEQLQRADLVLWIPQETIEGLDFHLNPDAHDSLLEGIAAEFPRFVTAAGRDAIHRMREDRKPELILEGIQRRTPDEEPASQPQIGFLKLRFRVDEAALAALGERQAHAAINQVLEMWGNRPENSASKALEKDSGMVAPFIFRTRRNSVESQYGLWTEYGDMPYMQGPFNRSRFLEWLATNLPDIKTRIVHIAKDGQLVEGAERAELISEAAALAADWVTNQGALKPPGRDR